MGNCTAAFEKWLERRAEVKRAKIDNTLGNMVASLQEQVETLEAQEQACDAKIRGLKEQQQQALKLPRQKNGQLKPETKQLLIKLKQREKLRIKERDQYSQSILKAEASKQRLEGMRTNTGLLKQHDQLVKGYKDLQKQGITVTTAEHKMDSASDVLEEIDEFNIAFAREDAAPVLTDEDMTEINAEIEAEVSGESLVVTEATSVSEAPIAASKSSAPAAKAVTSEEELARMVMEM